MQKSRVIILAVFVVLMSMMTACGESVAETNDSHYQIRAIARPYTFNFASWEASTLYSLLKEKVYADSSLAVENKLRQRIESLLLENGIKIFPPLNFKLENPPHLLVISPRDKIYYLDRVLLRQDLSENDARRIEAEVDKLGVSSLVTELGGFGATYPPIVGADYRLDFVINAIVEEWLHQYLAFKPLGFRYVLDSLGIKKNPDIIIMNETLAGMVSRDIGDQVYDRYYAGTQRNDTEKQRTDFDFDDEMRETRQQVDLFLSMGKIDAAESYMEERRLVFVSHGYNIRKLNQAYFAFHNIYGHDPASISPIKGELELLRARSVSLKDFLDRASGMRSYDDLLRMLSE